jgi:hypothetical protein
MNEQTAKARSVMDGCGDSSVQVHYAYEEILGCKTLPAARR